MNDKIQMQRMRVEFDAWIRNTIATHGWALQAVLGDGDNEPYCYTIGLSAFNRHPELVVVGLPQDEAAYILNSLGERVRNGIRMTAGDIRLRVTPACSVHRVDVPFKLVDVDPAMSNELLLGANRWYRERDGPPIRALQVLWRNEDVPMPGEPA